MKEGNKTDLPCPWREVPTRTCDYCDHVLHNVLFRGNPCKKNINQEERLGHMFDEVECEQWELDKHYKSHCFAGVECLSSSLCPGDCPTRQTWAGLVDKIEDLEDVASLVEALLERLRGAGGNDDSLLEIKFNGEHSDIWAAHLADLLSMLEEALKRAGR